MEKDKQHIPNHAKFIISGLAACGATTFCHPIDVIKNRMQLSGEGTSQRQHKTSFHALAHIVKHEGTHHLYDGYSANIARQLCYTTIRLGTFQVVNEWFESRGKVGLGPIVLSGLFGGFVASIVATPTDVALVRMTADSRLPPAERRNYKHVVDALIRIHRDEGVRGLWVGVVPTVTRAMVGNVAQLASYVQAKKYLRDYVNDGIQLHFVASVTSGIIYALATSPLDMAKTRLQTMKTVNGVPEYKGMLDVWSKAYRKEGFTSLWKGLGPYYFKIAPNTTLLFIFMEKLVYGYRKYFMDESGGGESRWKK